MKTQPLKTYSPCKVGVLVSLGCPLIPSGTGSFSGSKITLQTLKHKLAPLFMGAIISPVQSCAIFVTPLWADSDREDILDM